MISLEVRESRIISPHIRLVTIGGSELQHLEYSGNDQAVRLFFSREGQQQLQMPTLSNDAWMAQLLLQPRSRRPWVRMYTIGEHRPEQAEIDVEVVLHGDARRRLAAPSWR